ncbi:trypsin-like peptidase domain-containing protein [Streptomyces sp. RB6PN25]|uniref:Trypsin-like peptidase domain-containing protein n=1 Tax=Streptomyces humicola TaxID=2953240 RepID=A0ABT1PYK2_9ACTN|nr:trypsin-like peptidase domain-containing protein [Streptomyces humicola]MCQ4081605.1 trypsin-like peptidase domain-containing protein [Streptomyces humicola]
MTGSSTRTPRARLLLPCTAAMCATAVLAGCSGSSSPPGSSSSSSTGSSTAAGGPSDAGAAAPTVRNALENDYERTVKDVLPSVVQITSGSSLGSGVVYDTAGHIVTNAHVVGNARTFQVALVTGGASLKASLVGSFPADDLAVIKLDRPPSGLRPATFGDTSKVDVGQITLAMGNPLGLSSSVTEGIVSAVGRTVSEGGNGGGTGATIPNMVQTSAAINPGNSGGALVNLSSQVIGIPTLAASDPDLGGSAAPGIGFAIPVSTVTDIAGQLIKNGKVTASGRAALGLTARTVLGPNYQPAGIAVVKVATGGAADKAGIRDGDVITKVGSAAITTTTSLAEALASHRPGDRTDVTYVRNGSSRTVPVTLGQL